MSPSEFNRNYFQTGTHPNPPTSVRASDKREWRRRKGSGEEGEKNENQPHSRQGQRRRLPPRKELLLCGWGSQDLQVLMETQLGTDCATLRSLLDNDLSALNSSLAPGKDNSTHLRVHVHSHARSQPGGTEHSG